VSTWKPEVRYARGSGVNIAYQVFGDGDRHIVLQLSYLAHLERLWELPLTARMFRRLGSLGRVTMFNQRGVGLSDPVVEPPSMDERVADLLAVLDATGSDRAVVISMSETGPVAIRFAATRPERVEALVLYGTFARRRTIPVGAGGVVGRGRTDTEEADVESLVQALEPVWGTGAVGASSAPSLAGDEVHRKWLAGLERSSASPRTYVQLVHAALRADVVDSLGEVRAPTLVVHRTEDPLNPIDDGREIAAGIPGARLVELEGADHAIYIDGDQILDALEEFLTGTIARVDPDAIEGAVLFIDIVDSTGRLATMGDRRWHALRDAHDKALRAEFDRLGAKEVQPTGDGFMALFNDARTVVEAGKRALAAAAAVGLEVRAGAHAGRLRLIGGSAGGMVVHTAARVCAAAGAAELLVTDAVRDGLDDPEAEVVVRGECVLKGVPGRTRVWRVSSLRRTARRPRPER
jgi:pimeloyl-ACP methyl ester carboxylesterase